MMDMFRWIGAWWLGFPMIGCLLLALVAPLALFPQRLPKNKTDAILKNATETDNLQRFEYFCKNLNSDFKHKYYNKFNDMPRFLHDFLQITKDGNPKQRWLHISP